MAGTKEIKRRIKSIKNTKKITKAMELVAASKMKQAVSATLKSRLYAEYSWSILTSIVKNGDQIKHPLFEDSKIEEVKKLEEKILLLVVTSNRGLCGAYNAQAIKKSFSFLKKINRDQIDVLAIGKKGDHALRRTGNNIIASFFHLPNNISLSDIAPISSLVINEFLSKKYQKIFVVYTDFISALTQKANLKQILPVKKTELKELIEELEQLDKAPLVVENQEKIDYLFEANRDEFLGNLAQKLVKMQLYQMFLESNASEQSSRMMAMKNASEASGEMIEDLTLMFNKARQANITKEISEISAGMATIS